MIAFKALQETNSKKDYYKLFTELFCYVYRVYFNEITYEQPIITKNIQLILHNVKSTWYIILKRREFRRTTDIIEWIKHTIYCVFHKLLKQKLLCRTLMISVFLTVVLLHFNY
jgi:hypothetical protein